ncbi:MAG: hypothetical protein OEW16_04675 [Gammaproteobacteria bacterium]|nr:hypothetical protein [Gammaproteobacteria bacterium]
MFAARLIQGASGRLLPPSVPLRFLAMAVLSHVAFWAVLFATGEQLAGFRGGFAPLLAAVHLLTIGVLVCAVIGAAVQILPVVTRQPLAAVWPIRLAFWLLLPGLVLLVFGFYAVRPGTANVGGGMVAAGVCLFAAMLADNLRRAKDPPIVLAYGWAALAALVITMLLGVTLTMDFRWGGVADRGALALAHVILGGFGGMGLFAIGFSHVLVPMFTLAAVPDRRLAWAGFGTALLAVALGAAGALGRSPALLSTAIGFGLVASGIHLRLMHQALRDGMLRRLGLSFLLVRTAWVLLPATLGAALVSLIFGNPAVGPMQFGILLFAGWLLTFLLGILQRILPMLVSMHVGSGSGLGSVFAVAGLRRDSLRLHVGCHALAFAGVIVGSVANFALLVRAGSAIGLVGALAYAVFSFDVLRRLRVKVSPALKCTVPHRRAGPPR